MAVELSIKELAIREADPTVPSPWIFYGAGLAEYEMTFRHVLDSPLPNDRVVALDLMGPGDVLRTTPGLKAGLAVTLGDRRTNEQRKLDEEHNIGVITGNILEDQTWDKVSDWLRKQGMAGFNLILCRPLGGMKTIPNELKTYCYLLQHIYAVQSSYGGELLTQVPREAYRYTILWERRLAGQRGLSVNLSPSREEMKLIRLKGSPVLLPDLL